MIRYIAVEGIDGSGKDTQLAFLARRLDVSGITPIILHEPSYGPYGRALRDALADFPPSSTEQRELFTLDRRDHAARKIVPALAFVRDTEGFILLQNRSILSAAAYQPRGSSDADLKRTVEEQLTIAPMPDLIIVLDVPVDAALRRIHSRPHLHVLEREKTLLGVRERYVRLAKMYSKCVLVDATQEPAEVSDILFRTIYPEGLD